MTSLIPNNAELADRSQSAVVRLLSTATSQSRLGEILVARGALSDADLARALSFQETYRGRLGAILVRLGAISE